MIRVDREPCPRSLADNADVWTRELCDEWLNYHATIQNLLAGAASPKPPHAKKDRYANAGVKRALKVMFGPKCCYCEAKVDVVSYRQVEHFRPQSIYPALAYRWSNLLFACERCNGSKSDQFPLVPGEQQAQPNVESPCDLDDGDATLLIDPCKDDPSGHFEYAFDEQPDADYVDVVLVCKTRNGELSRGVYGLDRTDLVDDMREHLQGLRLDVSGYQMAVALGSTRERRQFERSLRKASGDKSVYTAYDARVPGVSRHCSRLAFE
jgi:uncharacterized protein (TIGR02646 family)